MSDENTQQSGAPVVDETVEGQYPHLAALRWKYLSGPDGIPLPIDNVEVVTQADKDGHDQLAVSLTGTATHYLKTERNPGAGSDPLDEKHWPDGIPFDVRISLESDKDLSRTLREFSSAFEIVPPITDNTDPETGEAGIDRLFGEHPDNVLGQITKKPVYIQVNVGTMKADAKIPGKFFAPPLYFAIKPTAKRTSVHEKGLLEKLRLKRLEAASCPIK